MNKKRLIVVISILLFLIVFTTLLFIIFNRNLFSTKDNLQNNYNEQIIEDSISTTPVEEESVKNEFDKKENSNLNESISQDKNTTSNNESSVTNNNSDHNEQLSAESSSIKESNNSSKDNKKEEITNSETPPLVEENNSNSTGSDISNNEQNNNEESSKNESVIEKVDEELERLKKQVEYSTYDECLQDGFDKALADTINILGFSCPYVVYKGEILGYRLQLDYSNPMEN